MFKLLVLYGTLTYNSEIVAHRIGKAAEASKLFDLVDVLNVVEILNTEVLLDYHFIIAGTSTWSEGNYPPDVEEFVERSNTPVNLQNKVAAFFALGEKVYENFCGGGIKFRDFFINNLNAKPVGTFLKIDGPPEEEVLTKVDQWCKKIFQELAKDKIFD